jgi:hypothetical protein
VPDGAREAPDAAQPGLSTENRRALALRGIHRAKSVDVAGARSDLEAAIAGPIDRDLMERVIAKVARSRR